MLVGSRMKKNPVTVTPDQLLSLAKAKMAAGGFRRLPVVSDDKLVGILTERDLRQHIGYWDKTKIDGVMTEKPITVTPGTTLEDAAQLMLKHKIGGLPVMADGRLVGIITETDFLRAFVALQKAPRRAAPKRR